jgi:hypothetical protein
MHGANQDERDLPEQRPVHAVHERDEARAVARRLRQMIDQIQLEMGRSEGSVGHLGADVLVQANDLVNELEAQFPWLEEEDGEVD